MNNKNLNESSQKAALKLARDAIENYLIHHTRMVEKPVNQSLNERMGAFVTLYYKGHLKGCIGRFEGDQALASVITDCAIDAAFYDPRFPSIKKEELKDLKIEISVMTEKKRIKDWKSIKLGIQGVVIQCTGRAGTFLPQVATETDWSLEQFLNQLCERKLGLDCKCFQDPQAKIFTFEVQIIKDK